MKRASLLALAALLAMALGQKTLVEGQLQGTQKIVGDTVVVELRGCWVHEGAVRCAFSFSGSRYNTTTSLGLRAADFTVTYTPTAVTGTTQAEPQTARARLLTAQETADKRPPPGPLPGGGPAHHRPGRLPRAPHGQDPGLGAGRKLHL